MLKVYKIKIFIVSILVLFLSTTCKKDSCNFPYATINAGIGILSDLGDLAAGMLKIFPPERFGGVGGLIIYMDYEEKYYAFDAACTYDFFNDCSVEISTNSFKEIVVCTCCNSNFFIDSDGGYVYKGPATCSLKQYNVIIDGNILWVRN